MPKRLPFVLIVMALLFAIPSINVAAQENGRTGLRPDAPPYGVRGPYPVGFAMHTIDDGHERPLDAYVWYPALNPDGIEELIAYTLPYWMEGMTLTGHALQDATPDVENGPYPFVIFAHGLSGQRLSAQYLCEHLASYGFVVMSVDYQDNQSVPNQPMYPSHISRAEDVSRQIDYAEKLTKEGDWAGLIDTAQVGVTGHSFGGYTALAAGGARLDWDHLAEVCETYPDPLGTCPLLLDFTDEMAALAGWAEVPDSPWPSRGDERVDAIAPLAPAGRFYGPAGVQDITVPVMLLGGTGDTIAIPEYNFYPIFEAMQAPKTEVLFEGGDHMLFFFECADAPWAIPAGVFWACSDQVWDMSRAHDLTDHFVTAFFLAELHGDKAAAAALSPDAVQFPGITYQSTEF